MRAFDTFDEQTQSVLLRLEERDTKERIDKTDRTIRLRQIPRESGEFLYQFLSIFITSNLGSWKGLEIGSSGGYSTIWQGLALKNSANGHLLSLEIDEVKVQLASKNVEDAKLQSYVTVKAQDAKIYIKSIDNNSLSYVFLDAEKEDYVDYLKNLSPKMRSGGILIGDNMESHKEDMKPFVEFAEQQKNLVIVILTIGKGLALIRWQ